jgi:hypothetical protein
VACCAQVLLLLLLLSFDASCNLSPAWCLRVACYVQQP